MSKELNDADVGIPIFDIDISSRITKHAKNLTLFDLSSHKRAREALDFGFRIDSPEFNIYVIGDDRTGRLHSTVNYIKHNLQGKKPPPDLAYLNNFQKPQEPIPFHFPSGASRLFKSELNEAISRFGKKIVARFNTQEFSKKIQSAGDNLEKTIQTELETLRAFALQHNMDIVRHPDGTIVPVFLEDKKSDKKISKSRKGKRENETNSEIYHQIIQRLYEIGNFADIERESVHEKIDNYKRIEAQKILRPLIARISTRYHTVKDLDQWLVSLEKNLVENVPLFVKETGSGKEEESEKDLMNRYGVNIIVEYTPKDSPPLIIEPNPTYENLFGSLKYQTTSNGYTTNFSLISPGSCHKANGGVLLLRIDGLLKNPDSWDAIKAMLRDRLIRIEEPQRSGMMPTLDAPRPLPVPFNGKIVLVGAANWFYSLMDYDPDFKTYFKVKADIERTFPARPKNLSTFALLLQKYTQEETGLICTKEALMYLIGYSTYISGHRRRCTAHFEELIDIVIEASSFKKSTHEHAIQLGDIKQTIKMRERRNSQYMEHTHEMIRDGILKINTKGREIGQVNGLTVQEIGNFSFGSPTKISARTSMGRKGVINVEHMVSLSGPIQQKGVLILEGYLKSLFAQRFPLSFNCTITFEQNYGTVEGDSASLAELITILSSLSNIPLRQDIAVTGAINQFGDVQAVGGVTEKIEGFFRICQKKTLTGTQGVIIPASNEANVILSDEIQEEIKRGRFHIWSVKRVSEALELLSDTPSGASTFENPNVIWDNIKLKNLKTVYGRAYNTLHEYNELLEATHKRCIAKE